MVKYHGQIPCGSPRHKKNVLMRRTVINICSSELEEVGYRMYQHPMRQTIHTSEKQGIREQKKGYRSKAPFLSVTKWQPCSQVTKFWRSVQLLTMRTWSCKCQSWKKQKKNKKQNFLKQFKNNPENHKRVDQTWSIFVSSNSRWACWRVVTICCQNKSSSVYFTTLLSVQESSSGHHCGLNAALITCHQYRNGNQVGLSHHKQVLMRQEYDNMIV